METRQWSVRCEWTIVNFPVMLDYEELEERAMRGTFRDWRKALRAPTTYRVGNAVRVQPQLILMITIIGCLLVMIFYYNVWTTHTSQSAHRYLPINRQYNYTYPLTKPLSAGGVISYRIGIIADLDTDSKSLTEPNVWSSFLKKGYLSYNPSRNYVVVSWDKNEPVRLSSSYSLKGRGMELSELIVFDGKLLTFDDRSGMVYEIVDDKVIPWVVLVDGNGRTEKGFKSEWATVRDEVLYVGSMGKEWTTPSGAFQTHDPMWIKAINMNGEVQHINWIPAYKAIRSAIGISWPGYMIHESGAWSSRARRWVFLPRRCSREQYNETRDELQGCNYLITMDSYLQDVHAKEITKQIPTHGFSSFKFIPGSNEQAIVALRTTEHEGNTQTFIMAFTVDGTVLLAETLVANLKYEGIEFI